MSQYNLVHKFIPRPHAMKNPDAKAVVDKEWKKLETVPAWQLDKVKKQEGGYPGGTDRQKQSPLCYIMDICHLKNWSWNQNFRSTMIESYIEEIL